MEENLIRKIEFRYGADLAFRYNTSVNETQSKLENRLDNSKTKTYSPGANLVLGFNYLISEDLILGIEFLPNFFYDIGESESKTKNADLETIRKSDNSGFNLGISSSAVLFTLTYRMRKS